MRVEERTQQVLVLVMGQIPFLGQPSLCNDASPEGVGCQKVSIERREAERLLYKPQNNNLMVPLDCLLAGG